MRIGGVKVETVISERSSEGNTFIVRAIQHSAFDRGEVKCPSTFICECDTEEMANLIVKTLIEVKNEDG